ncbi:helix-turn-helix domain-containing protein [Vibrio fluvialis]|nr:helix-turn-helix domain-containing protein [Vibrio fluvialis]MBY8132166.1 helix-turn-helix domain-containing protein [Vibrio fluvialis]
MSMELMVKAMKCKVGNPLRKLVLIKLADNANDQGECWPSYQYIADQCEISKRSVISHIDALVESGLLRKEIRKGGAKGNASNIYIINFGGAGDSLGVVQEIHHPSAGDSLPPSAGAAPRTSHSFEPVIEPNDLCLLFERFWKPYPRKNNKQGALKSFKAALKKQNLTASEFTEMLVSDVSERIKRKQFGFDKLHATTYLNNERWSDPHEENQPRVTESGYKPNSIDAYNERLLAKYGHAPAPIEREINPIDGSGLG